MWSEEDCLWMTPSLRQRRQCGDMAWWQQATGQHTAGSGSGATATNQPTHSHLTNFGGSWNCHFSSWLSDNGLVVASLLLTPYLASHKTYEVNTVLSGRGCGAAGPTIAKSQPAWILIKFFGQWDHILKLFCSRNQTFVLFSSQFNALVSWIL